ncbi:MAG TPA: NADH-quinone oxidoreductase subunit C [Coriobacteriia bacterium]|nr:NADH-quinone oxidoreductase subunit C [Coriobacteriia bacterium]
MTLEELRDRLAELSPRLYPLFSLEFGDAVLGVDRETLLDTAGELRELGFEGLEMVTAVDYDEWLVMAYRFNSRRFSASLFVKVQLRHDDLTVPSLVDLWPAALWQEREVWDLFGVHFDGHPDLRRIFLPEDFDGHPLRKDYDNPRMIRRPDYI